MYMTACSKTITIMNQSINYSTRIKDDILNSQVELESISKNISASDPQNLNYERLNKDLERLYNIIDVYNENVQHIHKQIEREEALPGDPSYHEDSITDSSTGAYKYYGRRYESIQLRQVGYHSE